MAAAVTRFFRRLTGPAAAGIAEFLRGRAFLAVAGCPGPVAVLFAACAGVD